MRTNTSIALSGTNDILFVIKYCKILSCNIKFEFDIYFDQKQSAILQ